MSDTTHLKLPYLDAAQAQKHVTHNEALRTLDALVQLAVLDRDLDTPPGAPAEGDRYLVASSPTAAWTGHAQEIAAWQDGAWSFHAPEEGWLLWIADEDVLLSFAGSGWSTAVPAPEQLAKLGINATADTTNRLAVSSAATLFNHAGNGHQIKLNKQTAGDTASLLYQTDFSSRAEMGTTGDDDFRVKVSPDGSTFYEAILIDRNTGAVAFPQGGGLSLLAATAFTASGTWTKPAGAKLVWAVAIGSGGGGGSGAAGDNTANRFGGGGGAAGTISEALLAASVLGATESVTVGAAPAGGNGVTGTASGLAGTIGGASSFGTHLFAAGGAAGVGGTTTAGTGGAAKVRPGSLPRLMRPGKARPAPRVRPASARPARDRPKARAAAREDRGSIPPARAGRARPAAATRSCNPAISRPEAAAQAARPMAATARRARRTAA